MTVDDAKTVINALSDQTINSLRLVLKLHRVYPCYVLTAYRARGLRARQSLRCRVDGNGRLFNSCRSQDLQLGFT